MIEAQVVATNHVTQILNFLLSLFMAILSVLMFAVGVLASTARPRVCDAPRFAPVCKAVELWMTGEPKK